MDGPLGTSVSPDPDAPAADYCTLAPNTSALPRILHAQEYPLDRGNRSGS